MEDIVTLRLYIWEGLSAFRGKVTGCVGSPVRLSIVCAQLLPEDSVAPWGRQKASLFLHPTSNLHFLNLNGYLCRVKARLLSVSNISAASNMTKSTI